MKKQNRKEKRLMTKTERRIRDYYWSMACVVGMCLILAPSAYAVDPLGAINNLSTFMFAAIKAIGLIILGWGVVQLGLSFQSHDASQRSNGMLTIFGGVIIAFAKEILDLISGGAGA